MLFRSIAILILLSGTFLFAGAQENTDPAIEQLLDVVSEDLPEDFDYSEFLDRINYYRDKPIDINKTDGSELKELLFLGAFQIAAILDHRERTGDFIDLLELQAIDGLDLGQVRLLLPFVAIRTKLLSFDPADRNLAAISHSLLIRYGRVLQRQDGYREDADPASTGYGGSPAKFSMTYQLRLGQHLGLTARMQKDAGETWKSTLLSPNVDLSAANISYTGKGTVRRIVLGKYSLQFGQGLAMWSGLSLGKGSPISIIPRQGAGLKPSSSASPLMALKGAALNLALGKFTITPFFSSLRKDATLEYSGNTGTAEVTAVNESGYRRTVTELSRQRSLRETVLGADLKMVVKRFSTGLTAFRTAFDHPFRPGEPAVDRFDFSGRRLDNFSGYYNYNFRNIYFFGELALSDDGGHAMANGLIASLSPKLNIVALIRNYARDYHSFFNQPVAEGSGENEKGAYWGINSSPVTGLQLDAYADHFSFPWLKYRVDAPSAGSEFYSQLSYSVKKRISLAIRYRYKLKEENEPAGNSLNQVLEVRRKSLRIETKMKITGAIELRNRIEQVHYKKGNGTMEPGVMTYQDLFYTPMGSRLSGNLRFGIFECASFNSRIYAFENDVLYSYSNPAFDGSGNRFYLNLHYRCSPSADLWFRYASTHYNDKETIGSGSETIRGATRSDLKLQLRVVL